jgi:phage FluMu gp28-like protein
MNSPIDPLELLPYQAAFAANTARFKIGLWARQTGKDHTATAEAVLDCLQNPGTTWIILAASERQAIESLAKAKDWAAVIRFGIDEYNEAPGNVPYSVARTASTEIKWSNGSRLIALPANAPTIRGYSANLILTEFAFHENPDAIWRAIYPTISNPLRGGVKKLRIISTPNGLNNKFATLWHSNFNPVNPVNPVKNSSALSASSASSASSVLNLFHKSRVTIHDAITAGLPLDAAELQAGLNDPEAWAQEYLCEFMDNSSVLLPYDLIEACESSFATELSSPEALSASAIPGGHRPQLFAGIDFARKNHLTVCWILEKLPASPLNLTLNLNLPSPTQHSAPSTQHLFLTREVLCLRNLSTPEQLDFLRPRLQRCQRICVDYTGPGIGLGDFLHREFNGVGTVCPSGPFASRPGSTGKVELCTFTSSFKSELFPRLAVAFENREILIPIGRDIREDLHSIYRTVTHTGNVLYRAHSTPDGHADRTTALALALRAAQSAPQRSGGVSTVGRKLAMFGGRNRFTPPQRTLSIIY